MPLFVEQLGVPTDKVAFYAGLGISISAISAAILSPIWGILEEKKRRWPVVTRGT